MWIPFTQLLLPPHTGRMRDFSQQVKQQAAGKSNSRLTSASERALAGGSERQDGSAIVSNNNTKYRAAGDAFFPAFLELLQLWQKTQLLETEAEAGAGAVDWSCGLESE